MSNTQTAPLSLIAAVDLTGSQFCGVVFTSAGVNLPSAGGVIDGVLLNKPKAGGICKLGTVPGHRYDIKSGGSIAKGDDLKVDASGQFITANATDVQNGKAVGKCTDGVTASGRNASMLMKTNSANVTNIATETIATSVSPSANVAEHRLQLVTADHVGTLADGKYVGQRHEFVVDSDDASHKYTLTVTTIAAGQTLASPAVFTDKGQRLVLEWTAGGYVVVSVVAAGIETVAPAGTANPLKLVHGVAVTNTVAFTQPDGFCPGHRSIWSALSNSGTPVGNISGKMRTLAGIAGTGGAGGVALLSFNAASDYGAFTWDGALHAIDFLNSATVA